jgi:hypothetical protein
MPARTARRRDASTPEAHLAALILVQPGAEMQVSINGKGYTFPDGLRREGGAWIAICRLAPGATEGVTPAAPNIGQTACDSTTASGSVFDFLRGR